MDEVRLIDHEGNMLGVTPVPEALRRAQEVGLDLVEVSPNEKPPVCKILDYGKYKYEAQKKKAATKKKQKVFEVKEIKIRPTIEEHDYQVKLRNMIKFLSHGDRVKVTLRFRGREMAHQDLARKLFERICGDVEEISKVEQAPKLEGRQMLMLLSPK